MQGAEFASFAAVGVDIDFDQAIPGHSAMPNLAEVLCCLDVTFNIDAAAVLTLNPVWLVDITSLNSRHSFFQTCRIKVVKAAVDICNHISAIWHIAHHEADPLALFGDSRVVDLRNGLLELPRTLDLVKSIVDEVQK